MNYTETISILPEDQIMAALFNTDFDVEDCDSFFDEIDSSVNKNNTTISEQFFKKNRKFMASQKYKIKDKRRVWVKARYSEENLDSPYFKKNIFKPQTVLEVSTKKLQIVEKEFLYEPMIVSMAIFKFRPLFKDKYFPFDVFSEEEFLKEFGSGWFFQRKVFITHNGPYDTVFVDYKTKKAFAIPNNFTIVKRLPYLNFKMKQFVYDYVDSVRNDVPYNSSYVFYGKKVNKAFINNTYLWGALGRDHRDYYEYKIKPRERELRARLKYDIKDGLDEYNYPVYL